jgi:glucose/arabinose dehydrogenase
VTERAGRLNLLRGGRLTRIAGVPAVLNEGQGGLHDVLVAPDFARSRTVYLTYAAGTTAANGTALARATLDGARLTGVTVIWRAAPKRGAVHFGGRAVVMPDGAIVMTTGDGFDFREAAQRLASPLGKTVRVMPDGRVPADNPFAARADAGRFTFTLGHRNPQGLAFDPVRRLLFAHEHGPQGGDEVNILRAGANYGWPVATFGRDYSGATISPYQRYRGMVDPLLHWTPSIAPSGLAVYRGAMFPEWSGDLLVGALVDQEVRRVRLDAAGTRVLAQQSLFRSLGARIRDVRVAPDGAVWLTTDEPEGRVIRVSRRG